MENSGLTNSGGDVQAFTDHYLKNTNNLGFLNISIKKTDENLGTETYTGFIPIFGLRKLP